MANGFTVVLIDDIEGSEGDFVHVETFETASALTMWAMPDSWAARVAQAARAIEEHHEHEQRAIDTAVPATPDAEGRDARFTRTDDGHDDPRDLA